MYHCYALILFLSYHTWMYLTEIYQANICSFKYFKADIFWKILQQSEWVKSKYVPELSSITYLCLTSSLIQLIGKNKNLGPTVASNEISRKWPSFIFTWIIDFQASDYLLQCAVAEKIFLALNIKCRNNGYKCGIIQIHYLADLLTIMLFTCWKKWVSRVFSLFL